MLGGSRLPKLLTIEHFIKEITDIVLLLNKEKEMSMLFTRMTGYICSFIKMLRDRNSLTGQIWYPKGCTQVL